MKPIIYTDASSLKDSSCLRRLIYNNLYGFRPASFKSNYKTGYGSAWHKAMEYWYGCEVKNKEVEGVAIQKATDYYKPYTIYIPEKLTEFRTSTHLSKSLEKYFRNYNPDAEMLQPIKGLISPGLLETRFSYPAVLLDSTLASEHFELMVAGTIDMIADYMGQEIFVDHKSTGTQFGYKDSFFADFEIAVQMKLYTLILKKLTGRIFPFMINGVFIKKPTAIAEKAGEFDGVNFERYGPRVFTEEQMVEFESWLVNQLKQFKSWLDTYYTLKLEHSNPSKITTPDFSSCLSKFGCQYIRVCSQSPENQGALLGAMTREDYEPLKFGE